MDYRSTYELIRDVAARNRGKVAYRYKQDGRWVDVSWTDQRDTIDRISKSLIAFGLEPGERVCILAQSRLEWLQCDLGIAGSGGVCVGIYPSNLGPACAFIVNHCEAKLIFVEHAEQLQKLLDERDSLPTLRRIVTFDGASRPADGVTSWDEFLDEGASVDEETRRARGEAIGPDDLASLIYTSGTTGEPKGAMITHRNLLFTTWSVGQMLRVDPGFESLLFLPLAHVFARMMAYCAILRGSTVCFAQNFGTVAQDMLEVRPQFFASVPRVFEKVLERITRRVEESGAFKKRLFEWGLSVGHRESRLRRNGQTIPFWLKLEHACADRLVLKKIRALFGGRLVWAVSGAAPLNESTHEFFDACGVTILQGIGMTENTSFSNVNQLGSNRIGTCGKVGPGIEMRLADDGEVLFRGENVMLGYFKDPEATAEAIDSDGWLHSGDVGSIDPDGYLTITDRKKDILITAGGKNIAPQRIERLLRTSPYISHVLVLGDRQKYLAALITLEPDALARWAASHGLGALSHTELAACPEVRELIQAEIDQRNRQLASFESIKRFQILPTDFSIETGELTPTLKLKRKIVVNRNFEQIQRLYA